MIDPLLWERLSSADPRETARNSACEWNAARGCYLVPMLGGEYLVLPASRSVQTVRPAIPDEKPPGFNETLLLVNYLLSAREIPRSGKLVPPERLPDGMFFFRGLHEIPVAAMIERFGSDPAAFLEAGKLLGAETVSYGDAALSWRALPRVPITFVLWRGDDEFPARASVLFDSEAHRQLALDALGCLASLAIKRLVKAAGAWRS